VPAFNFVLAGRYKLTAPLGEGGMAAVYRGRDLRLNREVAIKVLHDELTRDPDFLSRFHREAQLVASLSHPNIVPVYDVGEDQGTHFIVMEHIPGRALKDTLELEGRLEPHRAVGVMVRVLDALAYAHAQGLVHRDVKPQNILLMPDGTPRLADFGIARLADGSTTRTAAILGSAQYLSPEQSRGEDATPRSDIYACGIVLYEMLAGRPPFEGPNALAIAHQHLHDDPAPLRTRAPGVGGNVSNVVMCALSKNPSERFEDAHSFAQALTAGQSAAEHTDVQPPSSEQQPAAKVPGPPQAGSDREQMRLTIRRSARKSYLLAALFAGIVIAAAYLAQLPVWSDRLRYPSAPYALLPAALAVFALFSWFNRRSWVYTMDSNAAVVQWGLLSHHRFGVPLRHIVTLELKQSPIDRVLGIGTVELCARDHDGVERRLVMEDLPRPRQAYDELIHLVSRASKERALASTRVDQ
jgi:serine/threonine protein kinase